MKATHAFAQHFAPSASRAGAYLAVLAFPLVVACAGGSGTAEFDGITGNEPVRSGLDTAPTTGNEPAPAALGEAPAAQEPNPEDDTPKNDGGAPTTDAGGGNGNGNGACSGTYTCTVNGDSLDFPLAISGGKCTANGLVFVDGVITDSTGKAVGTYTANAMTLGTTNCPRSK